MKRIVLLFFGVLLWLPLFAQQTVSPDYNLSAEYKKYNNLKKAGIVGVVTFGATWVAGNVVCTVEQNRYANDHWDGNDIEEYARLSNEAKKQPAYKNGEVISIVGFLGTGLSVFMLAKYGTKAKRIRNSQSEIVATLGMDINPQGLSLNFTF